MDLLEGRQDNNTDNVVEFYDKENDILLEQYYAVYFDLKWYLCRIVKIHDLEVKIKFSNLDEFRWPKTGDKEKKSIRNSYFMVL